MVVDFALHPGRRIVGCVVDPRGAPCVGVYVAAVATGVRNGLGDTDWRSGRTAADGRFELLDLAADRDHALLLKLDGFATVAYDLPARARNETPFDIGTLELQPAATLRGLLLGARRYRRPAGAPGSRGRDVLHPRPREAGTTRAPARDPGAVRRRRRCACPKAAADAPADRGGAVAIYRRSG